MPERQPISPDEIRKRIQSGDKPTLQEGIQIMNESHLDALQHLTEIQESTNKLIDNRIEYMSFEIQDNPANTTQIVERTQKELKDGIADIFRIFREAMYLYQKGDKEELGHYLKDE